MLNRVNALFMICIFLLLAGLTACSPIGVDNSDIEGNRPAVVIPYYVADDDGMQDRTFRIDISNIAVTFDYYPVEKYVDCQAVVNFAMRPGQQRPVIHLTPAVKNGNIGFISLNDEVLDFGNDADMKVVSFAETNKAALELQRDLAENTLHTLVIHYRLTMLSSTVPMFQTNVNDIVGTGNEELFPTINTPHELSRHLLTFRVHGDTPFRCIGSGLVQESTLR